jgi:GDPmannose 4,6-dehydratase
VNKVGEHAKKGEILIQINTKYFCPTEVDLLIFDPSKAKTQLGWQQEYDLDDWLSI